MTVHVKPSAMRFKRLYIRILLFVLAKAIPKASLVSPAVRTESSSFPRGFRILLGVWPSGPDLHLVSDGEGGLYRYTGTVTEADLAIRLKSLEAAFRLFTFRESTAGSEAAGRLLAAGDFPLLLSFIRVIDAVEIILLPKPLAKLAVKEWRRPGRLLRLRLSLYLSLVLPARRSPV
jgi:hypothetical protein